MKRLFVFLMLSSTLLGNSQSLDADVIELDPFNKIKIHPYFEVVLKKGTSEQIEILSSNVNPELINLEVNGNTLHLYLEDAKVAFKKVLSDRFDPYSSGTRVKVVVTYRDFEKLTIYGEERLTILDEIDQQKLRLKIYGETDVRLTSILAGKMKVGLYGDNRLTIKAGDVSNQIYTSYGDNEVRAKDLSGNFLKFTNFGDNELHVGEQEYVRVTAFGDGTISYRGNPIVDRKITLGEMTYLSR